MIMRKYRHDPYAPVEYGYIDYHTMSYAASPALTPRASMALPPPMSMDDILTPAEYGAPAHGQPSFGHSPATSYSAAARSPPIAAKSTYALALAAPALAGAATSRGASPAATPVSMYAAGVRSPQATPLVTPSASPAASPSKFAAINKSFAAHSDQCFCAECTGVSSMATGGSGPFTQQPRLPAPRHAKAAAPVPGAPTIASTYGAASRSPSTSPAASAGFHRRPQSILLA
jgi:hypothetical protein